MILSRRGLLAGAGATAGAIAISGCKSRETAGGPVEIRYWTGWTGHELEERGDGWSTSPTGSRSDVRVRILQRRRIVPKVRIAFAGAVAPDVCSAVWADELAGYAMRGVLLFRLIVHEAVRTLDGELVSRRPRMLHYAADLMAWRSPPNTGFSVSTRGVPRGRAGPERPPRTIEELDAACEACTERARDGQFEALRTAPPGPQPLGVHLRRRLVG